MTLKKKGHGKLKIHTKNIFPIIKKWLYSDHDIFLRELISNSVDALNKRKSIDTDMKEDEHKIKLKVNKKKNYLQVIDYGIGMTHEEIKKYINQIAFSSAEDFVEKYKNKQAELIGHFGLGFYSTFMVGKKVTIDSLSYKEGADAAYWECEGETTYKSGNGKRKKVGTTVTVYLNEDSKEYLEEAKIKELVKKYSNFIPYPIYLNKEKEALNQQKALWKKKPKDIKDEEYKEFYKKLFNDYQDPLFWIHLNVEFPFKLQGILYFPKIRNELDVNKGAVKLFCNNVFVADDLKGLLPEFLLMLRGGIDIPDIPLNVSRSFLQNDPQVKKISRYIIKKIGDSLKNIFKDDRKKYEKYWDEINHFIKYGVLTEDKFYKAMKDYLIFKTTNDDYVTLDEYLERNKSDKKPQKIYYAPGEETQVTYLNLMKEQGIEVIFSNSVLDNHLYQQLESKLDDINFVRVDSEINENLVNEGEKEIVDSNNRTPSDKIKEIFNKTLNPNPEASFDKDSYKKFIKKYPDIINKINPFIRTEDDFTYIKPYEIPFQIRKEIGRDAFNAIVDKMNLTIETKIKHLKSEKIPAVIIFNEFTRRFQEMNYLRQQKDFDMLQNHTLAVNPENKIIKKILKFYENDETKKAKELIHYIHELALLEQKQFSGKELHKFINRANRIMDLID